MQHLSVNYSFAGLHRKTLATRDVTVDRTDKKPENLAGYEVKSAISEILKHSKTHRIVMINEAHDIAQHRVLTYRVLTGLWQQGYRYFGAESLSSLASSQIDKGYVTNQIGYYTREPTYANLVLEAKKIGFEIISYDGHKPRKLNTIEEREVNAALTIKEKVFNKDPNAKIVIHVGYAHISEDKWLASKLNEVTGLETLTVDQTKRIERSNTHYEHATYSKVVENTTFNEPFVFVKKDIVWSSAPKKWDMSVFWPRTQYLNGRPRWAALDRKTHTIGKTECKNTFPCMVEVFKFNYADEVPSDRIIIWSENELKSVFLSQGSNIVIVTDRNGTELNKFKVNH